jgi:hypothetical protein
LIASHDRAHRRRSLQRGRINALPLALQQAAIRQALQNPSENFTVRLQVDQPPRPRDRRVIRRRLRDPHAYELPQRQRIGQAPRDAALTIDSFEIADRQRTKIDAGDQAWATHRRRVEPAAKALHKRVKFLCIQKLVQALIERMTRRTRQIHVRNPYLLLLLLTLPCPHPHEKRLMVPRFLHHDNAHKQIQTFTIGC